MVRRAGASSHKDNVKQRRQLVVRKFVGAPSDLMVKSVKVDPPHVAIGTPQTVQLQVGVGVHTGVHAGHPPPSLCFA